MKFTYVGAQSSLLRNPLAFGKWSWMTDAGTKFNYVWYDPSVANTRRRVLVPTATLTGGVHVLQAASANYDCVSTLVGTTSFYLYSINSTGAGAFALVDSAITGITDDVSDIGAVPIKVVGPGCWAFRLGNFIYVKNAATTAGSKYTKSANGSILAGTSGIQFDPTLKFALKGN